MKLLKLLKEQTEQGMFSTPNIKRVRVEIVNFSRVTRNGVTNTDNQQRFLPMLLWRSLSYDLKVIGLPVSNYWTT